MSIYHKWKTIFIQIPRNASQAIHGRLRNRTDDRLIWGTFFDIMHENDPELFETYFSFACVRNPYERLISAYEAECTTTGSPPWGLKFEDFVERIYDEGTMFYVNYPNHYVPQYKFITIKDMLLVDEIIRYENINEDWKRIAKFINNQTKFSHVADKLEMINVNNWKVNKTWEDYYNEDTKRKVYELYHKDFELFGYEK
jgi:hypothetical protein